MVKIFKTLFCILLSTATVIMCSSCATGMSSQETTGSILQTNASSKIPIDDTAEIEPETYNYVLIKQKTDQITAKLDQIISEKNYNGTTYLKIGNDFEYINSSGYANKENHLSNSINTCYYTGSITKQFTAAAIMQLYEQEKLSLDETIEKYFPSFKQSEEITIKNLLTMSSGIPNYMNRNNETESFIYINSELEKKLSKKNSVKENKKIILDWIYNQELLFEPDSEFRFSDSNYYLLGEIIAKVSGVSYETYVTENILKPLGMTSSGFKENNKLATAYEGKSKNDAVLYNGVAYSSTGLISCMSDLLKWIDGLLDGQVVSNKSVLEMFTEHKDFNYGYGLYVNGYRLSHTGSADDYNSMMVFTRDKSEIYISLTNYAYCDPVYIYSIFKKSLGRYLG